MSEKAETRASEAAGDGNYIICEDLFKIYKIADLEVVALRGLDIKVRRGEVMAIIGASGSGKSTLLNILGGLETPSAGTVFVGKRDLLNISGRDLIKYRREDVGFVWQQGGRNLVPYLTAQQNVELPLQLLGWAPSRRHKRAMELLEAVGLEQRAHHRPDRLSGGEQQRVAIGVALSHNPPLLLADEPTGELDSQTAATILDSLRAINDRYGTTIVIVTHDMSITHKMDRVITIRDGRASLEAARVRTYRPPPAPPEVMDEYVVLDRAGRLQLPSDIVRKLNLTERVKVELGDDHINIIPHREEDGSK
jgi:ABC-type lipoprotein export system ATPase subunit